jgi:hypothetical protein
MSSLGEEDGRNRYSVWLLLPRIFKCLAKGVASTCGRLSPSPHDASPAVFRSHQTRTTSIMRPRDSSYKHTRTCSLYIRKMNQHASRDRLETHQKMRISNNIYSTGLHAKPLSLKENKKTRNTLISHACQSSITIPLLHQLKGYKIRRNQPLKPLSKLIVLSRHRSPKVS